jgi:starch synthase
MKVAICASEAVPFAKTGGLADVAGALPAALKNKGVDSFVIMPGYKSIFEKDYPMRMVSAKVKVQMNISDSIEFDLYNTTLDNVDFYFVRNDSLFGRENLYGTAQGDYSDNNLRFGFFSKAIFKVLEDLSVVPDIIHLHDHHFGLAALLLHDIKINDKATPYKDTKVVFTIHNIAYQGVYGRETLELCGIDSQYFTVEGLEFYGNVNFMKAGIVYSDKITTVSPTYAREILTEEYGYHLEDILKSREKDLSGIINGIDYTVWDPAKDKAIFANYDINDLAGKKKCKGSLISQAFSSANTDDMRGGSADDTQNGPGKDMQADKQPGITDMPDKPLIGMVSRLSEQKGIDLITDAMEDIMKNDVNVVILGTGEEKYHNILLKMQAKYKDRFSLTIGYSDKFAREIYSASDIFLMPSNYEPCGLGQLISLKYGTIPVVRNTGGLADTIIDINNPGDIDNGGQGFMFDEYEAIEFYKALKTAIDFYNDKGLWNKIVKNGMACDFSWDYSAGKYKELYESIGRKPYKDQP